MVEFRNLIVTALLGGLFLFALINASIFMTTNNNANNTLLDNEAINSTFGQLESDLKTTQNSAEEAKTGFEEESPTIGTDSFLFNSIIGAGKIFTGMWRNMYNLTFGLVSETIGISPIVLGTLTTILLMTITLLAWSLYKTGK